jgi:sugar phosphate isomerase/epimerase
MARQYSLSHLTLLDTPPPDLVRIAARAGYDFVGLRTMPLGITGEPRWVLEDDAAMRRETVRALADTGVRLLDVEVAAITTGKDPSSYREAFETAADLGARHVLASVRQAERNDAIDQFGAICDLARPLGLIVNLEFITFTTCRTLADAIDIVLAADRMNAGVLIDTLHFSRSRVRLEELSEIPASRLHYVHVSDAPAAFVDTTDALAHTARSARLFLGEGGIDIAAIFRRLPADTICALELPNKDRLDTLGPAAYADECLAAARRYFTIHNLE